MSCQAPASINLISVPNLYLDLLENDQNETHSKWNKYIIRRRDQFPFCNDRVSDRAESGCWRMCPVGLHWCSVLIGDPWFNIQVISGRRKWKKRDAVGFIPFIETSGQKLFYFKIFFPSGWKRRLPKPKIPDHNGLLLADWIWCRFWIN